MTLPKVELHVHLEGAILPELVAELARANGRPAPALDFRAAGHRWVDVESWRRAMRQIGDACLRTAADYERVAHGYGASLVKDGVIYAEVSVAPSRALAAGLPFEELVAAVHRGFAAFAPALTVGLIVGLDFQTPGDLAVEQVRQAAALGALGIVGVDLHGVPTVDPRTFARSFTLAREAGLGTRVHAGEFRGPKHMRAVLDALPVQRIAHGVRAVEDAALVDRLAAEQIALDVCLSSNVCLGVFPSWEAHPVRRLFEAGVPINLGSDDPLYFNTTVSNEYELAARVHGFSEAELLRTTRSALDHAFAPPAHKVFLRTQLARAPGAAAGASS